MVRSLVLMCLIVPILAVEPAATGAPAAPAGDEDTLFGFSRAVLTVLGMGAALVLLGILFMIRRFLGTIMNVVFLLLGTVLVIVALFGNQLGVYDAIDELITSSAADDPGP